VKFSFKAIHDSKNKLLNSKLEIDHNKLNGDTAQDSANKINTGSCVEHEFKFSH
jgi:hypothetical protein